MLIQARPCPCCGQPHGHGAWAAVNSSVVRPLRCRHCGQFFHQQGLRHWFWLPVLFPGGLLAAVHWSLALGGLALVVLGLSVWQSRKRPLVAGPRHG